MTFSAVVSSPLPSSHVIYPVFFLNSATNKIHFRSGVTPWRVSPGAVRSSPSPSDVTGPANCHVLLCHALNSFTDVECPVAVWSWVMLASVWPVWIIYTSCDCSACLTVPHRDLCLRLRNSHVFEILFLWDFDSDKSIHCISMQYNYCLVYDYYLMLKCCDGVYQICLLKC